MPLPFMLLGAAAIAGATGVAKGGMATAKNTKAKWTEKDAQELCQQAWETLELQRTETTKHLECLGALKVDVWAKEMNDFVASFHAFKNVRLEETAAMEEHLKLQIQDPQSLRNMEVATVKAVEIAQAGVTTLGAGALAGIASYGGAMMFASASTGTAIATLSGAAATNATLAWFGGGALAAGGFGMAGGTLVLGGIVAGPALAVAGFLMDAKAKERLAHAKEMQAQAEVAVEQMDTMTDFIKRVAEIADDYAHFLTRFRSVFYLVLCELKSVERCARQRCGQTVSNREPVDFDSLTSAEQKKLHQAWLMAQVLYSVMATPILTKEGNLDSAAPAVLQEAQKMYPVDSQEVWSIL